MRLPQGLTLDMTQNTWASAIEPIISNPLNNGNLLKNIPLVSGTNVINHKLGRNLQGWYITRQRGSAPSVYDNQDSNQTPQLTLVLVSSASCTIDLAVF